MPRPKQKPPTELSSAKIIEITNTELQIIISNLEKRIKILENEISKR